MNWKVAVGKAKGLPTSDIVIAAEDAARSVVLNGSRRIETNELLLAIDDRHQLQDIGVDIGRTKPKSSSRASNRSKPPLSRKNGKGNKP